MNKEGLRQPSRSRVGIISQSWWSGRSSSQVRGAHLGTSIYRHRSKTSGRPGLPGICRINISEEQSTKPLDHRPMTVYTDRIIAQRPELAGRIAGEGF